jgi:hypothetical protein
MTKTIFNRQIVGDQKISIALHMATKNQLWSPFEKAYSLDGDQNLLHQSCGNRKKIPSPFQNI